MASLVQNNVWEDWLEVESEACVEKELPLMHIAVMENKPEVMSILVENGLNVNTRTAVSNLMVKYPTDGEHETHVRATLTELVKNFKYRDLSKENKIKISLTRTTTPLQVAALNERSELSEFLLNQGADVNAMMEGGETALMFAILARRSNTVQLLLKRGADTNILTAWDKAAIHYAVETRQADIVEMLIKHGANVNLPGAKGLTALHKAAMIGAKNIVQLLLEHQAQLDVRSNSGATVLHYALNAGCRDILDIILTFGVNLSDVMKNGRIDLTPLGLVNVVDQLRIEELVYQIAKHGKTTPEKTSVIKRRNVVTKVIKIVKKKIQRSDNT